MKGDLALLSFKFGKFITSIEDIEEVHVGSIDGDNLTLEVVYCDKVDETCIAVAVPIKLPRHCDTQSEIDAAILELEAMECEPDPEDGRTVADAGSDSGPATGDGDGDGAAAAPDPALLDTMRRIEAVMNADFQDELHNFVVRFAAAGDAAFISGAEIRRCQMQSLAPSGFLVAAEVVGREAPPLVHVPFDRECTCAADFQQQILSLSARCLQPL